MPRVAILDYGMGNLRSVARAVERVGGEAVLAATPAEAARGDGIVVPGVGAFGACMDGLRAAGLDAVVVEAAEGARPMLAVCLGMQVLFEHGQESDAGGLGVLRGDVVRLPAGVKVPHMGWNDVAWTREHPWLAGAPSGTSYYFVHSYVCRPEEDVTLGEAEHGVRFAAAAGREALLATQFHPEKSGDAGLELYRAFVKDLA